MAANLDRRYNQQLQLLPITGRGAGLPADVLDMQHFVAEELLERNPLPPVSQQNLGKIGEAAKAVAAQQQLLILRLPGALLVAPATKPLDVPHPQRVPQGKARGKESG